MNFYYNLKNEYKIDITYFNLNSNKIEIIEFKKISKYKGYRAVEI